RSADLGAILEDLARRELARCAHHAATRVRAGATLVGAVDPRTVLRPAGRRPEEEHLRSEELAGEDIPLGEADGPLEVERRPDIEMQHEISEAREEAIQRPLHVVAEVLLLGVPVALAKLVRGVLDEARQDVFA